MAVTQYIGARYVPIIFQNPDDNSNDWKAGLAYEPLTIVSYAGGSYTSKTAVPAGASNPVDAPEYWVAIGLYSGQTAINTNSITQIRHALAAATEAGYVCTSARSEGDYVWIAGALYECTAAVAVDEAYTEGINITPVTDALAAITGAISQNTSDISDIGGDITTIQGDITSLQGDVTTLQREVSNPYTILIGDSYGVGYDPNGNNAGWTNYLLQMGVNGQETSIGGAAFGISESDPKSPKSLLSAVTVPAGTVVKRIVVALGYNDFKTVASTIITNIRSFITYAGTLYPDADIYIGMIGYAWTHNEDSINGTEITNTARAYAEACSNNRAIFMTQPLGVLLGCNGLSSADYKHPHEMGNRNIAAAIWAALHGNDYSTNHYYSVGLSNANIGGTGTLRADVSITNGLVSLRSCLSNVGFNAGTAQQLTSFTLDTAHAPIIPGFCYLGSNLMHNEDTGSGLAKDYYNTAAYWTLGMSASMNCQITMQMVNDAGNNFASSKHITLNDTTNYQSVGSFI